MKVGDVTNHTAAAVFCVGMAAGVMIGLSLGEYISRKDTEQAISRALFDGVEAGKRQTLLAVVTRADTALYWCYDGVETWAAAKLSEDGYLCHAKDAPRYRR